MPGCTHADAEPLPCVGSRSPSQRRQAAARGAPELAREAAPGGGTQPQDGALRADAWELVRRAMGGSAIKYAYDCKWQAALLLLRGVRLEGPLRDPKIAAWMLCPERTEEASIRKLASEHCAELQTELASMRGTVRPRPRAQAQPPLRAGPAAPSERARGPACRARCATSAARARCSAAQ